MDRAEWHKTDELKVPKNLTIILLPSRPPELDPVENIWQHLRQNGLSNRVFEDCDASLDAGNRLIQQPQTTMSIDVENPLAGIDLLHHLVRDMASVVKRCVVRYRVNSTRYSILSR